MYKTASRYLQYRARYPKKPKAAQPQRKRRGRKKLPPTDLRRTFAAKTPIVGKVVSLNKGGLEIATHGIQAFCPYSLMYPPVLTESDKVKLVGQKLKFIVDRLHPKVVLSRRAVIRQYSLEKIREAQKTRKVLDGRVIKVMDYGAFVDLGAVDGLLHISEISDGWIDNIGAVLRPGMAVRVVVLDLRDNGNRVSLSMRLVPH